MEYDLNLREYWRILRKRKFIVLFSALLTGVFSFSLAFLNQPEPVYQSTATVKIEKSSTTTGLYLESLSWSGADYLETQQSIITSYPIIEKTAKELGLIPEHLESNEIRTDKRLINIVLELKGQVEAVRVGDSNLIDISAEAAAPQNAQQIANTLARVYTQNHTAEINKRTIESRLFIEKQLEGIAAKLQKAEERLTRFREEQNVVLLSSQTTALLGKLTDKEAEYLRTSGAAEEMESMFNRLQAVQNKSLTVKENFAFDSAPSLYTSLNNKLVTLLLNKDTLLLTYTEQHPEVIEIETQVQEIVKNMLSSLQDIMASKKAAAEGLEKTINDYKSQLELLPSKGLSLARLERDVNFNEKVYALLEEKLQEARIKEAAKIEEVIIVKPGLEPQAPMENPLVKMKTLMGVIVGLVIGLVLAFIYETFDTSIGAVHEVEEFIGVDVLGIIPNIDQKEINGLVKEAKIKIVLDDLSRTIGMITHFIPNAAISECFRSVRTNVQFAGFDKQLKTIAVTSAVANEGKSSVMVNVAIAMAQAYNRVLLVDADLRKPDIARIFGISEQPGLTEIILGSYDWRDVVQNITDFMLGKMDVDDIMLTPGLDNIHVIAGGRIPMNPAELLTSEEFDNFFKSVHDHYDVILIDLPPILSAADTSIISSRVDGVVMVYRAGNTARGALWRAKEQLTLARANIVGIILNGLKAEISADFGDIHSQYGYEYGGGYGKGAKSKSWLKKWFLDPFTKPAVKDSDGEKNLADKEGPRKKSGRLLKVLLVVLASALLLTGLYLVS